MTDPAPGTGDYAFASSDGFGDFGIPGTLPGGGGSDSGHGGGNPGLTAPSSHSGPDGGGTHSGSGGSSGNGPTGNGSGSLLDPPGGSTGSAGGTGSNGSDPITGSNTHQATVPEPSTLALFLAGTAVLVFALRRRLRSQTG